MTRSSFATTVSSFVRIPRSPLSWRYLFPTLISLLNHASMERIS